MPEEDPATVLFALRSIRKLKMSGEDVSVVSTLLRAKGRHQHAELIDFLRVLNLEEIEKGITYLEPRSESSSGYQ
jgi:hypothetical protein